MLILQHKYHFQQSLPFFIFSSRNSGFYHASVLWLGRHPHAPPLNHQSSTSTILCSTNDEYWCLPPHLAEEDLFATWPHHFDSCPASATQSIAQWIDPHTFLPILSFPILTPSPYFRPPNQSFCSNLMTFSGWNSNTWFPMQVLGDAFSTNGCYQCTNVRISTFFLNRRAARTNTWRESDMSLTLLWTCARSITRLAHVYQRKAFVTTSSWTAVPGICV